MNDIYWAMLQTNQRFCTGGLCSVLDEPLWTDFTNAQLASPGPLCASAIIQEFIFMDANIISKAP